MIFVVVCRVLCLLVSFVVAFDHVFGVCLIFCGCLVVCSSVFVLLGGLVVVLVWCFLGGFCGCLAVVWSWFWCLLGGLIVVLVFA